MYMILQISTYHKCTSIGTMHIVVQAVYVHMHTHTDKDVRTYIRTHNNMYVCGRVHSDYRKNTSESAQVWDRCL